MAGGGSQHGRCSRTSTNQLRSYCSIPILLLSTLLNQVSLNREGNFNLSLILIKQAPHEKAMTRNIKDPILIKGEDKFMLLPFLSLSLLSLSLSLSPPPSSLSLSLSSHLIAVFSPSTAGCDSPPPPSELARGPEERTHPPLSSSSPTFSFQTQNRSKESANYKENIRIQSSRKASCQKSEKRERNISQQH